MTDNSFSKLGGQCLIAGGIISFIPFFLQIFLGGPPPDNVNIFSHFANITAEGGSLSILYIIMGIFGTILIMHGISSLNSFLQEKQKDSLLGLGTFLFLVGQFLNIIAWSIELDSKANGFDAAICIDNCLLKVLTISELSFVSNETITANFATLSLTTVCR